ncbi:class I SAM-dependent methyltransferase [Mesorhizobium sp. INR15]|uniref:class I SAM-dependent methyltransferase n=1 Tax=Mesorhizobium sp. INR15 TaxID=2654248 RepID=UPI001896550E|nr:class I SAM-dependent methyltransferase [Mesorhizobium sp. INR15]QPC95958.1 methyltransferase domain-containing protein [Mesorhizobium sp. INR15]
MAQRLDARTIVAELLDELPIDDARAMASRRDLLWINALMLQTRIMASMLRRHVLSPPARILELGCGDGSLMLAVARRMGSNWRGVELVMLDQADLVTKSMCESYASYGWRARPVTADIFEWLEQSENEQFDLVCANLILHHFSDDALGGLFATLQKRTNVFVATEPRRNALALAGCSMLRLIGVNDVTMHDAAASVRAGFDGKHLTNLWSDAAAMKFEERFIWPFTHAFAAERIQ